MSLVPLYILSKILPNMITVTQSGQVLADYKTPYHDPMFVKNKQVTQTIS